MITLCEQEVGWFGSTVCLFSHTILMCVILLKEQLNLYEFGYGVFVFFRTVPRSVVRKACDCPEAEGRVVSLSNRLGL